MPVNKPRTKPAPRPRRVADRAENTAKAPKVAPDSARTEVDLGQALVDAYWTNERINQLLLDMIDPAVWRAFPACSSRRNVATSFAHIHNVRCMRIRAANPALAPGRLDRGTVTREEVRSALGASARAMVALITASLARGGRVRGYPRDIVLMTIAAIGHDAHHRGQICHWLRELGAPLSPEKQLLLWEWDKRSTERQQ